jgi:signal transduction histidine kinase
VALWRRLRSISVGLRERIVGVVLLTTAVTLGVAALTLLPRLESSLRKAAMRTLQNDVVAASGYLFQLEHVSYQSLDDNVSSTPGRTAKQVQQSTAADLSKVEARLRTHFSATSLTLVGYIDANGHGHPVLPVAALNPTGSTGSTAATTEAAIADAEAGAPYDDVRTAFIQRRTVYSFNRGRSQVRAAIWLGNNRYGATDAVLAVRRSIDEVPEAVATVRRAVEIAAIPGVLLTAILVFPLASRAVRRVRMLREAALRLAVDGSGADFPIDRTHDEIGDLSRSFAIVQRRLRQQEAARRAFVSTASHELRTPLASLGGMLELLAEDLDAEHPDLKDANELLGHARAQSDRLARLAADLLDLSRLDAEVKLRSEPVELGELVRAVQAEFEARAGDREVALRLETPGTARGGMPGDAVTGTPAGVPAGKAGEAPSVWALADPGSVARIIRILLDNALRVAPRSSEIVMRVGVDDGEPAIRVSDAGPGVPKEERGVIFERFQRGRSSTGKAGFGLGLAIGRELAERMGGALTLLDDDGSGATFSVKLRSAPPEDAETGEIQA